MTAHKACGPVSPGPQDDKASKDSGRAAEWMSVKLPNSTRISFPHRPALASREPGGYACAMLIPVRDKALGMDELNACRGEGRCWRGAGGFPRIICHMCIKHPPPRLVHFPGPVYLSPRDRCRRAMLALLAGF